MKVFLVASGSYSDYMVLSVFSTREAAEAMIARHGGPKGFDIEEYDLDPGALHARDGYFRFHIEMDRETGDIHGRPFEAFPDSDEIGTTVEDARRPPHNDIPNWPPYSEWIKTLKISCWARDLEHAIKIASEHRRSLLAAPSASQPTTEQK